MGISIKMAKFTLYIVAAMLAITSAFMPVTRPAVRINEISSPKINQAQSPTSLFMAEDMTWEGEYPPSKVLGPIMSKMPSGLLGLLSGLCLAACVVSVYESGQLQQEVGAM